MFNQNNNNKKKKLNDDRNEKKGILFRLEGWRREAGGDGERETLKLFDFWGFK